MRTEGAPKRPDQWLTDAELPDDVAAHVDALIAHGVVIDTIIYDPARLPLGNLPSGLAVVTRPLADSTGRLHMPDLLAAALADIV